MQGRCSSISAHSIHVKNTFPLHLQQRSHRIILRALVPHARAKESVRASRAVVAFALGRRGIIVVVAAHVDGMCCESSKKQVKTGGHNLRTLRKPTNISPGDVLYARIPRSFSIRPLLPFSILSRTLVEISSLFFPLSNQIIVLLLTEGV